MGQRLSSDSNDRQGVPQPDEHPAGHHLRISPFSTVRDVLTQHPERSAVLERWNLPDCCDGSSTSLMELCAKTGVDVHSLLVDIHKNQHNSLGSGCHVTPAEIHTWPDRQLVDHWQQVHHTYFRKELPALRYLLEVVTSRHGDEFPRLRQLRTYLQQLDSNLCDALDDEDGTFLALFKGDIVLPPSLSSPLHEFKRKLKERHRNIHWFLTEIKTLTNGFQVPENACGPHRELFSRLEAFVLDLEHFAREEAAEMPARLERLTSPAANPTEPPAEA